MAAERARAAAAVVAAAAAFVAACSAEPRVYAGRTMGTSYSVSVGGAPPAAALDGLAARIQETLDAIDGRMSTYKPDSELSRFNAARDTAWRPASPQLVEVVAEALRVSRLSGGAFDVTVGPLVDAWGFGPAPAPAGAPPPEALARAAARVGHAQLEVRAAPPMIRKRRPDLSVDLSAIAKGYAADRVAALLRARGIENFLVEVGGELRVAGVAPAGRPWRVGIERPADGPRAVFLALALEDGGVATSGDYRNYREIDGRRYAHEIDPRSGAPVRHRAASVTVIDATAMRADALATALFVLGERDGLALAEREGLAACFIVRRGDGFAPLYTRAFERRLAARDGLPQEAAR